MQASDAIISKINHLLNKTVDNGCSVAESASAAKIAQQLLTQYRLSYADLSIKSESIHKDDEPLYSGQRLISWKDSLACVLCEVNGCKAYSLRNYKGASFRLVGRDSDIQIVRYFFNYLSTEVERLCKHAMQNGNGSGKTWSNNFKHGAVAAICERLKEGNKEVIEANDCQAIVKLSMKDDELKKWVKDNLKLGKPPVRTMAYDLNGYGEGVAAGKKINLNKGIGGKSDNKLLE